MGRHQHLTLAGSITGAVIVALDGTVLTVAQPTMQRDLNASFTQVQWTSTGYLIAVASLLVFSGRLGDRYGHQRIFAIGMLGFAAASAAIGLAPGVGWVIGLRVAQGVFGALLQPATLGMLRAAYPRDQLGRPIALRTSAIGAAAAAGPVVGGALAAHWGWRAVFFLGVVPALAAGALALVVRVPEPDDREPRCPERKGPERKGQEPEPGPGPEPGQEPERRPGRAPHPGHGPKPDHVRLDLPGACLLAAALACLVHTLVGIPESGWTAATGLGLAAVTAAGGAFVRHERRTASPLVPPSVFRSAAVAPALGVLVAASAALFGALFLGTYFLQDVLALDPLQCGLRVLPLAVMMVLSAPVSAVLMRRQGARRTAVAGMALLALGILLLSRLDQGSTAVAIGGCFLVLGAGFGTVMVTATAVVVRHAPLDAAGVAGGLQQTAMNIGPALGVAAATMLMTLSTPAPATTRASGAGPRWTGDAFTSAMGPTLVALAAVAAAGTLLAAGLPSHRTEKAGQKKRDGMSGRTPVRAKGPR
ncbi:MFS transporter [Streptomyces sp. XD-27]|uniref:MFS transporter n=1 Tax=Streptomyces sp. XD-27 TaxID=3062779 RepID=UPI0026F42C72|nr:MFS transporter [Streptomyces sp. XD-27]WKX74501.1 MFS transporter [Streptomyces sp. XD-27]